MGPQVKDPALSLPWVTALAQVQSSAPGHTSRCPRPGREGGREGDRNLSLTFLFLGGGVGGTPTAHGSSWARGQTLSALLSESNCIHAFP